METDDMPSIRKSVLEHLARKPMTTAQLLEAIPEIENKKQLANCLHRLRCAGDVARLGDGHYATTGTPTDRAPPPPAPPPPPSRRRAAADDDDSFDAPANFAALRAHLAQLNDFKQAERTRERVASDDDTVRTILERAVADSQQALDEYVTAVADPRILGPLRNARDEARAALAALDNAGGPSC